jgi:Zn-finger nucleic acid-binding protein
MTERQGVEIDYCAQCRGVWLDRGELDKIIERSAALTPDYDDDDERTYGGREPYGRESHGRESYQERRYGHHKKKSFWREIFDFD